MDSPLPGVQRVMLDRVGGEVAIATSLVRYAPGSRFDAHVHGGGEEFLVLDGVFSDEQGDYPTGTYVRNPKGTRHAPFSEPGCVLFVKLWQFDDADDRQFSVRLTAPPQRLFERGAERVTILEVRPGASLDLPAEAVAQEVLVMEGLVEVEDEAYDAWSWLRVPAGTGVSLHGAAGRNVVFHKTRPVYRAAAA